MLLDAELATLYGVTTKRLNEQVKRNAARFPEDFLFRLSAAEVETLNRSQIATGSQKHRDPRPSVSNTNRPGITCTPTSMPMAKPASSSQRPCKRNVGIDGNGRNGSLRLSRPLLLHMVRRREVFIKAAPCKKLSSTLTTK